VETTGFKSQSSLAIVSPFAFVCHTVDFDYEFSVERHEIHNVSIDRVLAPKLPA
jgi:hypothetical protein